MPAPLNSKDRYSNENSRNQRSLGKTTYQQTELVVVPYAPWEVPETSWADTEASPLDTQIIVLYNNSSELMTWHIEDANGNIVYDSFQQRLENIPPANVQTIDIIPLHNFGQVYYFVGQDGSGEDWCCENGYGMAKIYQGPFVSKKILGVFSGVFEGVPEKRISFYPSNNLNIRGDLHVVKHEVALLKKALKKNPFVDKAQNFRYYNDKYGRMVVLFDFKDAEDFGKRKAWFFETLGGVYSQRLTTEILLGFGLQSGSCLYETEPRVTVSVRGVEEEPQGICYNTTT